MAITKRINKSTGKLMGYQVVIDRRDPVTQERRRATIGTFKTKKEAEKREREALARRDGGTLIDPVKTTVADVLDHWYAVKSGAITSNSLADYESAIRNHVKPALGHVLVQKLGHGDVQAQAMAWRDAGMGPRLLHRCLSVLRQSLAQAMKSGLVIRNAAADVELPAMRKKRALTVWTVDEVAAFLDAAEEDALAPLWHLLVLEGMRRSEALGLRWSDLNWRNGGRVAAHIQQTNVPNRADRGQALLVPRTKTAAGSRTVLLTEESANALKAHQDRQRFTRLKATNEWQDHDLVVCTSKGTPVNPATIKRNQHRLMLRAGVPHLTTHDLRHTAATLMLLAGVPVKIVSEKLGHASVSITMDLYAHVLPDMQDQASDAMDEALRRGRAMNDRARNEADSLAKALARPL